MSFTTRIRSVVALTAITTFATFALSPLDAEARWGWKKSQNTIAEIVSASGGEFDRNRRDYDLLLISLQTANLAGALNNPSDSFTVFAPNDGAFIKLAQDLGFEGHDEEGAFNAIVEALTALGGGDPIPLLTDVLLYHVSPGAKYTRQIRRSDVIETLLDGGTIVPAGFTLLDAEPELVNPRIRWRSNIKASNGVIHTLNRVLIPADLPNTDPEVGTITDIVAASGGGFDRNRRDFDLLFNAVSTAGLAGALADTTADYTVLAPNDAAFIRLARDLGYRGWREQGAFDFIVGALTELGGGDPIPLLTDILLYHVSPGSQVLKDVVLTDSIETLLSGAVITPDGFTLEDGAPSLRDPKLKVSGGDIRASNGLIHTITRVLIPVDVGG